MTVMDFHHDGEDTQAFEIIEKVIFFLRKLNTENKDLHLLLGEHESLYILKTLCKNNKLNIEQVLQTNDKHEMPNKAKLLLHMLFLHDCYESIDYISQKLYIDKSDAQQFVEHFKNTFSIDDPLTWLLNLQQQIKQQRHLHYHNKEKILHGADVSDKPEDTAEYRKLKLKTRFLRWFTKLSKQ